MRAQGGSHEVARVPTPFSRNPLAGNIFLVEWMQQVREAWGSGRLGVGGGKQEGPWKGLYRGIGRCFSQWPQRQEMCPDLVCPRPPSSRQVCRHLPSVCPIALSSVFWGTAWTKTSHRWAEVDCALCSCPVGPFILSLGCCSLKAPKPWRKGQP